MPKYALKKGVPGQLSPSSLSATGPSLCPRKALRTANPLSEIHRRPLETGKISKPSACHHLQGSPFAFTSIKSVQEPFVCSPARGPVACTDRVKQLSQNHSKSLSRHQNSGLRLDSKLPATSFFVSSGPRIVEGHSLAVPRNQQQPN